MKRLALLALLTAYGSAYALNPVQGFYGGILLGPTYTPSTLFFMPADQLANLNSLQNLLFPNDPRVLDGVGNVNHGNMGQIGAQLGYRCGKYRVEGQFTYNNSPINSLEFGDLKLSGKRDNYAFSANLTTSNLMLNGFYDFMPSDPRSNMAPYLGVGVGYMSAATLVTTEVWQLENGVGTNVYNIRVQDKGTSIGGQIILGASYFLDDFSTFGFDFRYLTSSSKDVLTNTRIQIYSLNLTFNGVFNVGG